MSGEKLFLIATMMVMIVLMLITCLLLVETVLISARHFGPPRCQIDLVDPSCTDFSTDSGHDPRRDTGSSTAQGQ